MSTHWNNWNERQRIGEEIIGVCERLHERNMLAAADGNVSFRISNQQILVTPRGLPKAFLKKDQLAVVDIDGKVLAGTPSSETPMHLQVYRECPKAQCVIHAHPPTAIAWTIAFPELTELPAECVSEVILAVGSIPIVPYARPGTQAMGDHLTPFLPTHRVMILARHGALSWGESLQEAYNGIERLEHSAQILMAAKALGGLTFLPSSEVQVLKDMRKKIGERTL